MNKKQRHPDCMCQPSSSRANSRFLAATVAESTGNIGFKAQETRLNDATLFSACQARKGGPQVMRARRKRGEEPGPPNLEGSRVATQQAGSRCGGWQRRQRGAGTEWST